MQVENPKMIWQPSEKSISQSNVVKYIKWLKKHKGLEFTDYDSLWEWSITKTADFWASLWEYFEIIAHSPYQNVLSDDKMPNVQWFEGATLNYAEHVFRNKNKRFPAIIFESEGGKRRKISWAELEQQTAAVADFLKTQGVKKGDRVVAYLPNIPEATVAMLATVSLGAIWSSCSPDFGTDSVIERFQQIEPKVLFAVNGYAYNAKPFDKKMVVSDILNALPTVKTIVTVDFLSDNTIWELNKPQINWAEIVAKNAPPLQFEPVPFSHPIWILYSSGTTGKPKAITHSQGGILMEHLKYLTFHNDLKKGERFFWFSTTGWMMWNFVQSTLLLGATVVLYEGSPMYPNNLFLWKWANDLKINHFGTSAPYILACKKAGIEPNKQFSFEKLRSISSTGAPLPPEGFDWIYENIKADLWFCSMSGGTDLCTAFVGGVPTEPVYQGEIQRPSLGAAIFSYNEEGKAIVDEVGEMVIAKPMPSMPIYFWNDPNKEKYLSSYFDMFDHIWRHGDWLTVTKRKTLVISGRSDATLNRNGIRIGTAEIYRAIDQIPAIADSLIVNIELKNGEHYMPLFVQMKQGIELDNALIQEIAKVLKTTYSPRHVPDEVIEVSEIPYTISGKKLEAPVKKILMGMPIEKAANTGAMRNPQSLNFFIDFAKIRAF